VNTNPSANQKVQVSRAFLDGVWLLLDIIGEFEFDNGSAIICKLLKREAEEKYRSIERRELFAKYKTATPGSTDRETFRKSYLDAVGIHRDWRSGNETFLS
jgi:hypothetical protein